MVIPERVTYLIKTELGSINELVSTVEHSISNSSTVGVRPEIETDWNIISTTQSEILLLLAEGYTYADFARQRGNFLRASGNLA